MTRDACHHDALMTIEDALEKLLLPIVAVSEQKYCPLLQAYGQVLAEPVISALNIPLFDNSAMDGFAVRSQDLQHCDRLTLQGKAMAGSPFNAPLMPGNTVRIMTGAAIPQGADAVVMQEQTQSEGEQVRFLVKPLPGESLRKAGEDIAKDQTVLPRGKRLSAADIGVIASLGMEQVQVIRPLKVALFSTGDELVAPGNPLKDGQIYDSNRPALVAILKSLGVEVVDLGLIEDSKAALRSAMLRANECDAMISSGGVSVGEADYTKAVLEELGQVHFWKLAIKPGKPFAFGHLGQCAYFGLPGNPVSAMVTFHQLVLPALRKLSGQSPRASNILQAICSEELKKAPGRMEFQRGIYHRDAHGVLQVKSTGKQGSGLMTSVAKANCYILLAKDKGKVGVGEKVDIQPFDDLQW
ncbi:molybdopterin molybdotransferase MoeA [Aliiglaciecola sp. CAU 1673]|uniref:molybdopterin molybdotransferase MoeA n=1 Tax=Aliiglaciecola sp. CAU 1673 TaxID=3032595 RepID=UPI0023DB74A8|nr:molybdopterin molybdotransferase MoeA [Aliiglaciecola sp. CAU 1673]MDF2177023.1 molybdopterin molybdotransferase MoeA [Aliiglaciecola sp. CAU 1673]